MNPSRTEDFFSCLYQELTDASVPIDIGLNHPSAEAGSSQEKKKKLFCSRAGRESFFFINQIEIEKVLHTKNRHFFFHLL